MAVVRLGEIRIHREGKNAADQGLNPVRQGWRAIRHEAFDQFDYVPSPDVGKNPPIPFGKDVFA
jgi:hypothetical protein